MRMEGNSLVEANARIKLLTGILWSIFAGLALVAASGAHLLPAAPDKFTYDWRTYFLTAQAERPRDDIALILIDEQSLTGYHYLSPIDRGLTAELITLAGTAEPKAIGLDFIIDRPTEPAKDDALKAAIRLAKAPIILGAIDNRAVEDASGLAYQEAFIASVKRPAGHVFFGAQRNRLTLGDQAVRFMLPPSPEPPSRPAFARLLADIDGTKPEPKSDYIFWLRPPMGSAELFPTFTVPPHRDDAGNPTGSVLPESWRGALKGKIVLIGGAFADRDLHLTPLTVAAPEPVHGVQIHAQILAQLRDGRTIYELPPWAHFLIAAAVAGLGFFAAQRWTLRGDAWISSLIAFVAIVAAGGLAFWSARIILPSATLFLAWALGLFAGNWADAVAERLGRIFGNETTSAARG